jgi:hypothetical protein
VHLDNFRGEYLPILSRDVLRRIAEGDETWEAMVPSAVADLIKRRSFFGYTRPDRYDDDLLDRERPAAAAFAAPWT